MWPEITHVLRDTLHDHRRALGWWALGLSLYTLSVLAVYPAFKHDPSLNEVMRSLPDALKVLFGEDYTSPAGYVGGKLLSLMPVLLSLYAGLTGAGLIAGAERRGHLEFPLATPLSRTGLLAGRTLALLVLLLALGGTLFVATWVGGALFQAPLNAAHLLTTVALHTLGAWVFGALALAAGARLGSGRGPGDLQHGAVRPGRPGARLERGGGPEPLEVRPGPESPEGAGEPHAGRGGPAGGRTSSGGGRSAVQSAGRERLSD